MEMIDIGIILIGLIVIAVGFKKIKGVKAPLSPMWSVIIGGALILGGLYGTANLSDLWTTDDTTTPVSTIVDTGDCCEFDITPSVSSSEATLNSDETKFTVSAYANTTAHTITENDNTTWVNPVLQFVIKPEISTSTDTTTAYPIYYEVTNPELTSSDGTDTYKMFTKSGGNRQLIWSGDGTSYVDGTSALVVTDNLTLTLTMTCSQDSFSRMENTYDPVTCYIRFYNTCGWSETYEVDFMLVHTYT